MRGGKLLAVLAVALAAAGCMTPESAGETSGGKGSYTMRIHVTDEPGGPALAGARVVVTTLAESFWGGESRESFTLATGPEGVAEAHVEPGSRVTVEAYLQGYTFETRRNVPVGGSGDAGDVTVPLYHEHVTLTLHETMGPAGASAYRATGGSFQWDPHELAFGGNDEARRGYAERVVLLNFTLDWDNSPTAMGDLGIGAGKATSEPDVVQEADGNDLPPGHYQEKLSLGVRDMQRAGWQRASHLYAGAGTPSGYVAPMGMPYTLKVDATFDGNQALRESPGFNALWGALVALGGVALALGRRAP